MVRATRPFIARLSYGLILFLCCKDFLVADEIRFGIEEAKIGVGSYFDCAFATR